jgi:mono/diheme cytochrome c family protein
MRSEAQVQSHDDFVKWAQGQGKGANPGNAAPGGTSGKKLFVDNGCNGCHTFKPAGSTGTVGPDLDKLTDLARKAGKPLDEFIRESIVDPGAYVEPGYPNAMPGTFSTLPKEQIDALVKYLAGGGS